MGCGDQGQVSIRCKRGMEQQEKVYGFLGPHFYPLAIYFTGFSACYPLYDHVVMLNMVRHATHRSLFTGFATTTVGDLNAFQI